jgi:hypothetical protein
MSCAECKWRAQAQRNPNSILARLWRWHTGWCPGWRRYQAQLAAQGQAPGGESGTADGQPRT